jgi:hypothetical protein
MTDAERQTFKLLDPAGNVIAHGDMAAVRFWRRMPAMCSMAATPAVPWVALSGLARSQANRSFKSFAGTVFCDNEQRSLCEQSDRFEGPQQVVLERVKRTNKNVGRQCASDNSIAVCTRVNRTADTRVPFAPDTFLR